MSLALALARCSENGDEDKAIELIRTNPLLVSTPDPRSFPPLHVAGKLNRKQIVKELLAHGADITTLDSTGHTVFHFAAASGRAEVVQILVDHCLEKFKDDPNKNAKLSDLLDTKQADQATALHFASFYNFPETVQVLLENGASPSEYNILQDTPLHQACQNGNLKTIQNLLRAGANINKQNSQSSTPFALLPLSEDDKPALSSHYSDQARFEHLSKDLGSLYLSSEFTDVSVITNDEQNNIVRLSAHKAILSARCPILLEKATDENEISLLPSNILVAKALLEYIYTGDLVRTTKPEPGVTGDQVDHALSFDLVLDLIRLAHDMKLERLVAYLGNVIYQNVDASSVTLISDELHKQLSEYEDVRKPLLDRISHYFFQNWSKIRSQITVDGSTSETILALLECRAFPPLIEIDPIDLPSLPLGSSPPSTPSYQTQRTNVSTPSAASKTPSGQRTRPSAPKPPSQRPSAPEEPSGTISSSNVKIGSSHIIKGQGLSLKLSLGGSRPVQIGGGRKSTPANDSETVSEEKLMTPALGESCEVIMHHLIHHERNGSIFNSPVPWREYGLMDYLEVIKKPMDLGTISKRLENNYYSTLAQWAADVRLVWSNCIRYNTEETEVHSQAIEMSKVFEKQFHELRRDADMKLSIQSHTLKRPRIEQASPESQPPTSRIRVGETPEMTQEEREKIRDQVARVWNDVDFFSKALEIANRSQSRRLDQSSDFKIDFKQLPVDAMLQLSELAQSWGRENKM